MNAQSRIIARLRRLVRDAEAAGLALVADAGSTHGGIRVMTAEEARSDDLRYLGVHVPMHEGCGGSGSDRSGGGNWM